MDTTGAIAQRLRQHAEDRPDHPAVLSRQITLSYADLAGRVEDCARQLQSKGVGAGACVAIDVEAPITHLIGCLALSQLGTGSCALPRGASAEQQQALAQSAGVTHRLREDGAGLAFTPLAAAPEKTSPDTGDARLLFATSGTTGRPKIVVFESADLIAQAPRHVAGAEDRFACLAALAHNFAKRHRLYCVAQGATNVFLDPDGSVPSQCAALGVSVLHLTAFQARELLAQADGRSLAGVRLKIGGSHVPLALRQRLCQQLTSDLHCGYGTTETGAIAFSDPRDPDAGDSVGRPLPGIEVRILRQNGSPAAVDETGEITVRGLGMFREYLRQPELSAERLREGWFFSGDLGRLDAQGRLSVCGRADDMFVFNSMNIIPQDLEATICQYPAVADAAVVPRSSPVHGHIPVALVRWAEGQDRDLSALKDFVRQRAGVRCPRQYIEVAQIPRNAAGKILRSEAAALLGGASR